MSQKPYKIKFRFNIVLLMAFLAVFIAGFSCAGQVRAANQTPAHLVGVVANQTPAHPVAITKDELQRKIDSMTNSEQKEPESLVNPTYTPADFAGNEEDNTAVDEETKVASEQDALTYKRAKSYMSPYKILLILFAVDLILLGAYFMYSNRNQGKTE